METMSQITFWIDHDMNVKLVFHLILALWIAGQVSVFIIMAVRANRKDDGK